MLSMQFGYLANGLLLNPAHWVGPAHRPAPGPGPVWIQAKDKGLPHPKARQAPWPASRAQVYKQPGSLKLLIQVFQLNEPVVLMYSLVAQKVQSSTGSTEICE